MVMICGLLVLCVVVWPVKETSRLVPSSTFFLAISPLLTYPMDGLVVAVDSCRMQLCGLEVGRPRRKSRL
jgi:hypothetical protein